MNADTEDALDELMSLFPLTTDSARSFDEAVAKLAVLEDPEAIPAVLDLADESCTLSGLMESLMESLEVFPAEEFVPRFLSALPGFARRNPQLAKAEVTKLLWSSSSLEVLMAMGARLPASVKRSLRTVLLEVKAPVEERDRLLALVQPAP